MSNRKLTEEDLALLQAAMKGVKPLKKSDKVELKKHDRTHSRVSGNLRKTTQHYRSSHLRGNDSMLVVNELSDHLRETVTTDQALFYAQPGLPPKLLHDLKQGKIKQSAILDLHGYTVERARDAILRMINACLKRGIRCFRIIHGKGKLQNTNEPILKNHVNNWLQQHQHVLAFCSAKSIDGGTGAVYVLLKNLAKLEF
jgi:DNA-nicking Smr family endonuclease